jgi:hypothetical protein
MTVWSFLKLTICLWLLRKAARAFGWLVLLAAAVAAWPLTLVTAAGYGAAWARGWPPARLRRAAAWSLPPTFVWAMTVLSDQHAWAPLGLVPATDWQHGWHTLTGTGLAREFLQLAPFAVPAGLLLAAALWAWRNYAINSGLGGWMASAPISFDAKQWRRQVRTAKARTAAPGTVPLLARGGRIPVGATIRAIGHRWHPVFTLPHDACGRHMVIVGSTGSGKTNLMIRLWAGWYTAALDHAARGGRRPLLVVLDCKGGPDARVKANRTRRLLHGAGARRVAIWPDEASLSLWDLPPQDLAVLLYQMIETGDGAAAYYADILQAVLTLAVTAPTGPPGNAAEFLGRLDAGWLAAAWAAHPGQAARITGAAKHLGDIQLRYATLLGRLGPALDGPGTLADADAWYFILEGTRERSVAEAQAMAVTELAARAATDPFGPGRAMLLAADDYSAVSGRVPLSNLYERGRSLGIGVQVSAQSWQGLGATEDERYRIAATADGGIFVMRTPYPEPLTVLAGTRRVLETAHKVIGNVWGDEGTTREQRAWVADPDLIRRLQVGQACYINAGAATFLQVARPKPSPLTLAAGPAAMSPAAMVPAPRSEPAPDPGPGPGPWPDPAPLEDFFGPGAAP